MIGPRCPVCDRRIRLGESYLARMNKFTCPTCGSALRVPTQPSFYAGAFALFLIFRSIIHSDLDIGAQAGFIAVLSAGVLLLEYVLISTISYRRADARIDDL